MGQYTKAEPLYQRSLQMRETELGKDHPAVAESLNYLAGCYRSMGQYARADTLYQRSLELWEAKLTKDHPDVGAGHNSLAGLREATGKTAQATDLFERARRGARSHIAHVLPALSETEQANFLCHKDRQDWHVSLSLGLRHASDQQLAERSAAWLLNGKAIALQALAQAALGVRNSHDPALHELNQRLLKTRQELARLALAPAANDPTRQRQRQRQLDDLGKREEELARQAARLAANTGSDSTSCGGACRPMPS